MTAEAGTPAVQELQSRIDELQTELTTTNHEILSLTLELDQRVEERTAQLQAAQDELQRTNSDLLQLTLELEDRVAERTDEVRMLNAELERRVEERTAELAEVNKELETFAYSVSHDLRAPLRGIDGWSLALLEDYGDALDDTGRGFIRTVRAETERMAQLIDALLQLSRVTRREMRREVVDLTGLAREVAEELRQADADRRAEIVIVPGIVAHGDRTLLRAVLQNLLGNAWKFTNKREHARIELGIVLGPGQRAYFVRDNGAGFNMAFSSKLFAPFQRLHNTGEFPGTGVGLATVQRIIGRHGGRVWAEGVPDEGATFYFTLGGDHGDQDDPAGRGQPE